jgi:hypothetical protein
MNALKLLALAASLFLAASAFADDPSLNVLLNNHLVAAEKFYAVCSSLERHWNSVKTPEQFISSIENFKETEENLIATWPPLFARLQTITKNKEAFAHSLEGKETKWFELTGASGLTSRGIEKYTSVSPETLDHVRPFVSDPKVHSALVEALTIEERLQAQGNDGIELLRMAQEWQESGL